MARKTGAVFAVAQSTAARSRLGQGSLSRREFDMPDTDITCSTSVDDLMRRWPATIRTFLNQRMNCPGCPIACFHTVADACREHHVDMDMFLRELRRASKPA